MLKLATVDRKVPVRKNRRNLLKLLLRVDGIMPTLSRITDGILPRTAKVLRCDSHSSPAAQTSTDLLVHGRQCADHNSVGGRVDLDHSVVWHELLGSSRGQGSGQVILPHPSPPPPHYSIMYHNNYNASHGTTHPQKVEHCHYHNCTVIFKIFEHNINFSDIY